MPRDRRPSGLGNKSRRFAEVTSPGGEKTMVPAPKDAATYLYLATPEGGWPDGRPLCTLLYDATWMVEGVVFELEEMGPGRGMGDKTTVRVTDTRAVVAVDSGRVKTSGYGQIKRSVLLTVTPGNDDMDDLSPEKYDDVAELKADDLEDPS